MVHSHSRSEVERTVFTARRGKGSPWQRPSWTETPPPESILVSDVYCRAVELLAIFSDIVFRFRMRFWLVWMTTYTRLPIRAVADFEYFSEKSLYFPSLLDQKTQSDKIPLCPFGWKVFSRRWDQDNDALGLTLMSPFVTEHWEMLSLSTSMLHKVTFWCGGFFPFDNIASGISFLCLLRCRLSQNIGIFQAKNSSNENIKKNFRPKYVMLFLWINNDHRTEEKFLKIAATTAADYLESVVRCFSIKLTVVWIRVVKNIKLINSEILLYNQN